MATWRGGGGRGGVHRERSSKQCDDGTQVRPRASSELDGLKKLFIFLPSALFIIALNRRVEKKGMEKAKRNRVYVPLCPFVDFQPRTGFLSLLSLSLAPASFSLSLSLSSLLLFLSLSVTHRRPRRPVRYRRMSQRCITVNGSGNCTLNISGLSPCKHVKKVRDLALWSEPVVVPPASAPRPASCSFFSPRYLSFFAGVCDALTKVAKRKLSRPSSRGEWSGGRTRLYPAPPPQFYFPLASLASFRAKLRMLPDNFSRDTPR